MLVGMLCKLQSFRSISSTYESSTGLSLVKVLHLCMSIVLTRVWSLGCWCVKVVLFANESRYSKDTNNDPSTKSVARHGALDVLLLLLLLLKFMVANARPRLTIGTMMCRRMPFINLEDEFQSCMFELFKSMLQVWCNGYLSSFLASELASVASTNNLTVFIRLLVITKRLITVNVRYQFVNKIRFFVREMKDELSYPYSNIEDGSVSILGVTCVSRTVTVA